MTAETSNFDKIKKEGHVFCQNIIYVFHYCIPSSNYFLCFLALLQGHYQKVHEKTNTSYLWNNIFIQTKILFVAETPNRATLEVNRCFLQPVELYIL